MTTREKLALAFEEVNDHTMAAKARQGYYDDMTSPMALPILQLIKDCTARGYDGIAYRALNGAFDGD